MLLEDLVHSRVVEVGKLAHLVELAQKLDHLARSAHFKVSPKLNT